MKTVTKALFLSVLLLFTACSGSKKGFSLGRSRTQIDIDECLLLSKKKKHDKAIKCFESYRSANRGTPQAGLADLSIADSYFSKKEFLSAAETYDIYIQTYPYHNKIPYAHYKKGLSYLKASPKSIDRDQAYIQKALEAFETVLFFYKNTDEYAPASLDYKKTKERIAKKEYYVGRFYYKNREYLAANERFKTVVNDYNDSGLEDKSLFYLIVGLKKLDQKDFASEYLNAYKEFYPDRTKQYKKMDAFLNTKNRTSRP